MKLVIVESPAKCETIKRYLGEEYEVVASYGHVRDLATSGEGGLGVDITNSFAPTYAISKGKRAVVNSLKEKVKKSEEVILATDPDREGEAIAWHLADVLGLDIEKNKRIVFHEITKDAIEEAIKNPRTIDMNLVESQEARRIIDRILGFKLSALMFKKINSRSAGRVQSPTLQMIDEHDREINSFVPKEYWLINANINVNGKDRKINCITYKDKKIDDLTSDDVAFIKKDLPEKLTVQSVEKSIKTTPSKEPFSTSTLDQEASSLFKFSASKTQRIIQTLYDGVMIGNQMEALISYIRVDSTRLAPAFVDKANKYIEDRFGKEYYSGPKKTKKKNFSQDAHEAIRPTNPLNTPESVKPYLNQDQYKLYTLIYNRTLASLLKDKKDEILNVTLSGNDLTFKLQLSHNLFKGYEKLTKYNDEEDEYVNQLPNIKLGDMFDVEKVDVEQKFTEPPAHYTEGKIIKLMEEVGIGRPSTYASTLETLRKRKYVNQEKGAIVVSSQGDKTSRVLQKYFPKAINVEYTAGMENQLDLISSGEVSKDEVIKTLYDSFMKEYEVALELMYKDPIVETGEMCPDCGAPLIYKHGRNGDFIGCSKYPSCSFVKKEEKEPLVKTGEMCPHCNSPLVIRKDKKGNTFIACSNYPVCQFTKSENKEDNKEASSKKCPECGGDLIKKKGPYGYFLGCSNYPKCKYIVKFNRNKYKKN